MLLSSGSHRLASLLLIRRVFLLASQLPVLERSTSTALAMAHADAVQRVDMLLFKLKALSSEGRLRGPTAESLYFALVVRACKATLDNSSQEYVASMLPPVPQPGGKLKESAFSELSEDSMSDLCRRLQDLTAAII